MPDLGAEPGQAGVAEIERRQDRALTLEIDAVERPDRLSLLITERDRFLAIARLVIVVEPGAAEIEAVGAALHLGHGDGFLDQRVEGLPVLGIESHHVVAVLADVVSLVSLPPRL